jgi:hypothetical protein
MIDLCLIPNNIFVLFKLRPHSTSIKISLVLSLVKEKLILIESECSKLLTRYADEVEYKVPVDQDGPKR